MERAGRLPARAHCLGRAAAAASGSKVGGTGKAQGGPLIWASYGEQHAAWTEETRGAASVSQSLARAARLSMAVYFFLLPRTATPWVVTPPT